jgi:hypothetical protein
MKRQNVYAVHEDNNNWFKTVRFFSQHKRGAWKAVA